MHYSSGAAAARVSLTPHGRTHPGEHWRCALAGCGYVFLETVLSEAGSSNLVIAVFQLESIGRWLIAIGLGIALLGLLLALSGKVPLLKRLGKLPGDMRYQSADGRFSCFVPIVSSILLSIVLTVVLNVILRLLRR